MTVRELAEFVLNHDIDTVTTKCKEISSEDVVYSVTVLDCWNQGVQTALCLDCLSKLVSLGQMVLHTEGNVQMVSIDEMEDSTEKHLDISN